MTHAVTCCRPNFVAALLIALTAYVACGFTTNFPQALDVITSVLWGRIMLADLYTGLALFACLVGMRERSIAKGVGWFAVFAVLGNIGTAAYLLWQLRKGNISSSLSRTLLQA